MARRSERATLMRAFSALDPTGRSRPPSPTACCNSVIERVEFEPGPRGTFDVGIVVGVVDLRLQLGEPQPVRALGSGVERRAQVVLDDVIASRKRDGFDLVGRCCQYSCELCHACASARRRQIRAAIRSSTCDRGESSRASRPTTRSRREGSTCDVSATPVRAANVSAFRRSAAADATCRHAAAERVGEVPTAARLERGARKPIRQLDGGAQRRHRTGMVAGEQAEAAEDVVGLGSSDRPRSPASTSRRTAQGLRAPRPRARRARARRRAGRAAQPSSAPGSRTTTVRRDGCPLQ